MSRVALLGATGKLGRATLAALLTAGAPVAALARRPDALPPAVGLVVHVGDAARPDDVAAVVKGADAVIVSLGNSQNPLALRLGARRMTAATICADGTRNVIAAMATTGARRLIVVTAFGVGDTRALPSMMTRWFFHLVLKEHMADKEEQELLVKASGLDWTLVQPVALTDHAPTGDWLASDSGRIRKGEIARSDVAAFILSVLSDDSHRHCSVTLSG